MADIAFCFRKILVDDAGVSALVGTRVYPRVIPQKPTYPLIVFRLIGGDSDMDLSGGSGFAEATIDVACFSMDQSTGITDVATIDEAVRAAATAYRGTVLTVFINEITSTRPRDDEDQPTPGSDSWRWIRSRDYEIKFHEAIVSVQP